MHVDKVCKLQKIIERQQDKLADIQRLVEQLPSGIDYGADPADLSPPDMTAHIGGLIYKVASTAGVE